MTVYNYRQGQVINFSMKVSKGETVSGTGIIIGLATGYMPVLGCTYMVKPTQLTGNVIFPNDEYPFECIAVAEIFITWAAP